MLDISYRDETDIEYTFIRGLSRLGKDKYSVDYNSINLLKINSNIEFEETYDIVNSDICMVMLKDGFGNYIEEYHSREKLLDDIIDSRQLFMSSAVFGSDFVRSSIKLNLSN